MSDSTMKIVRVGDRHTNPQVTSNNAGVKPNPVRPSVKRKWFPAVLIAGAFLVVMVVIAFLSRPLYLPPLDGKAGTTFLVVGKDMEVNGKSRSDTLLLARVQFTPARHLTLISIPRDTRVQIPGKNRYSKINAAYSQGGRALLLKTLAANFHVTPDHTIVLESKNLSDLVNALGGVEVAVPKAMDYDDTAGHLHIHLKPGKQHLDGEQAVGFVRFRKDGLGDLGRIERQKYFLKEVAHQALTPATLFKWKRIDPVLKSMIQSDLTTDQMLGVGWHLRDLKPSEWSATRLPGRAEYRHGVSYYIPDTTVMADLLGQTDARQ